MPSRRSETGARWLLNTVFSSSFFFSQTGSRGGQITLTTITGEQRRGGFFSFVVDLSSPWLLYEHLCCLSWAPVLHSIREDPLLHLCLLFMSLCMAFLQLTMADIQEHSKDSLFANVLHFISSFPSSTIHILPKHQKQTLWASGDNTRSQLACFLQTERHRG